MVTSRSAGTIILLASVTVVGTALGTQYLGGLQPCELCLYERWPYYAVIVLGVLALPSRSRRLHRLVFRLCVVIFAASALLALYHVAVEHHWVAGPAACTGSLTKAGSVEARQRALEGRQPVSCDAPQWSYRGITLAGLNLAASIVMVFLSLWALNRRRFGRRR